MQKAIPGRGAQHLSGVESISWTSDGKFVASGSLDTHIKIWAIGANITSNITISNAVMGGVNAVLWLDEGDGKKGKVAGVGADACVRVWEVTF